MASEKYQNDVRGILRAAKQINQGRGRKSGSGHTSMIEINVEYLNLLETLLLSFEEDHGRLPAGSRQYYEFDANRLIAAAKQLSRSRGQQKFRRGSIITIQVNGLLLNKLATQIASFEDTYGKVSLEEPALERMSG